MQDEINQRVFLHRSKNLDQLQGNLNAANVVSTIRLNLAPKIKYQVLTETSPTALWQKLEKIYMSKSLSNRLYLKKDLYQLQMDEGSDLGDNISEFNRLMSQLLSIDVKLGEDQAILLLSSLPKVYETLMIMLLIGKETLHVDDVMSALMNSSKVNGTSSSSQGDGLMARSENKNGSWKRQMSVSRGKQDKSSIECWWKEIRHDNTVTWLAFWNDPINPKEFKYVFLAASSSLKGQSDMKKYNKARELKDDDEADTVGCCTLKVENVEPKPPNILMNPRSLPFQSERERVAVQQTTVAVSPVGVGGERECDLGVAGVTEWVRVTKKADISDFYCNLSKNVAFGAREIETKRPEKRQEEVKKMNNGTMTVITKEKNGMLWEKEEEEETEDCGGLRDCKPFG
ncbi:hypothetical protein RJ640_006532 [Escallonia rubra]|uniref:DNA topoisomerase I eukaryotic-type domain-containing protein n=1 Tax=Escallonia rubra TaxID=112253 RepID=A0AA88QRB9_9ASTE|nr:hypothetical protein RJ640_006532 [Escallonia rubra]